MNLDASADLLVDGTAAALARFLTAKCGVPVGISGLRRLAGGASHDTLAFDAEFGDGAVMPLVLRRDFAHGLLDMAFARGLAQEFALLTALHLQGVPVPRPRWHGDADAGLGTPFMLVDRSPGTDVRKLIHIARTTDAVPATARQLLGRRLAALLARLHAIEVPACLSGVADPAEPVIHRELTRWARIIEASPAPHPLLHAALDWLRAGSPEHGVPCLVHGDFKTNNLLADAAHLWANGTVAVLDWEMAHPGDPIEDLAWTLVWTTPDDLIGGLLEKREFIAAYEEARGQPVSAARLFYWEVFSYVKLAAIFIAGVRPSPVRAPLRPMLALLGRALPVIDHALARLLPRTLQRQAER